MKQQIEIDVPEGMRVSEEVRFYEYIRLKLEPIPPATKRRPPTKHDLLGVDSLECWVRNFETEPWLPDRLVAVGVTDGTVFYGANNGCCRYCEIEVPADEQPLRECWVDYYHEDKDPWGSAWADRDMSQNDAIHMIEVRP